MALLLYFLCYFVLGFVLRSALVYRRTGINPLVLPNRDDAYGYVGRAFKLLVLFVAVVVGINATVPEFMVRFGSLPWLQLKAAVWAGWVLLLTSLAWLLLAQTQMGDSWRVGIDETRRTALVKTGLFSLSRNPIFLAMRVNLLGLFLVLPNAATLAVLIAGELLIQVQVRLEEAHLEKLHSEQYKTFCTVVRRWL